MTPGMRRAVGIVGTFALFVSARPPVRPSVSSPACDPDNGGLTLPPGFCALVVADQVGSPRHLAVAPNGDLFVALENRRGGPGGVLALRDTTGDGRGDVEAHFGAAGGTGIALASGGLYFATRSTVLRYPMRAGRLTPLGEPQVIARELPSDGNHTAKNLALSADGKTLFVNLGSATNSCQVADRTLESPGRDPCPELAYRSGIWRFDAGKPNQTETSGARYATGIRNAVGLALAPDGQL